MMIKEEKNKGKNLLGHTDYNAEAQNLNKINLITLRNIIASSQCLPPPVI
jgi:hypothetical protein